MMLLSYYDRLAA